MSNEKMFMLKWPKPSFFGRWTRTAAVVLALAGAGPALGTSYGVDSDTGAVTLLRTGQVVNNINGTEFITVINSEGAREFRFKGNLRLNDGDVVHGVGSRPISFVAGANVYVAPGAIIDVSAHGITAGAGGGNGGLGGAGSTGGDGAKQFYTFVRDTTPPSFIQEYHGGLGGNASDGRPTKRQPVFGTDPITSTGRRGTTGRDGTVGTSGAAGTAGSAGSAAFGTSGLSAQAGVGGDAGVHSEQVANGGAGGAGGVIEYWGYYLGPNGPDKDLSNAVSGTHGDAGEAGEDGKIGYYGFAGEHDAAADSLRLVGGNGGAGGGGGGGGAGGNSGGGGGSGGGGADANDGVTGGYGRGGHGGHGGIAGDGGDGGMGSAGGGGGGAFALSALGRIEMHGTIRARGETGAQGQRGEQGQAGEASRAGGAGVISYDEVYSSTANDGAKGGNGGAGGNGGNGGYGGTGGSGAGGTIKLVATDVVSDTGARLDTSGGGGGPGESVSGDDGRVLLGSTVAPAGPGPDVIAKSTYAYDGGPVANNRYAGIYGAIETPLLLDLVGGPEAFGVVDAYDSLTMPGVYGSLFASEREQGYSALLLKLDDTISFTNLDYVGYDIVALVNLLDQPLQRPTLWGAGTATAFSLFTGGWMNDALFGGISDTLLSALSPHSIYLTLVPEFANLFTGIRAEFDLDGQHYGGAWSGTGDKVLSIGQRIAPAAPVPEPGTLALLMIGVGMIPVLRRRPAR